VEIDRLTSREFRKAAAQRLKAAEALPRQHGLDAMYLAGYTIECALKALILELASHTDPADKVQIGLKDFTRDEIEKEITSGPKMHYPEVLAEFLKDLGRPIPLELRKKFRRSRWSTSLRYESGRRKPGEVRWLLKLAGETYRWVESQLP
jgi:hypothetical protein